MACFSSSTLVHLGSALVSACRAGLTLFGSIGHFIIFPHPGTERTLRRYFKVLTGVRRSLVFALAGLLMCFVAAAL